MDQVAFVRDLSKWLSSRSGAAAKDRTDKHPVMPGSLTPARGFIGFVLFESGATKEALAEFGATTVREQNRYSGYVGAKWNSHLPHSRSVRIWHFCDMDFRFRRGADVWLTWPGGRSLTQAV
jgi:hypothetical protein